MALQPALSARASWAAGVYAVARLVQDPLFFAGGEGEAARMPAAKGNRFLRQLEVATRVRSAGAGARLLAAGWCGRHSIASPRLTIAAACRGPHASRPRPLPPPFPPPAADHAVPPA
jgi:hypothetical protein